jgi:hypothetical protein
MTTQQILKTIGAVHQGNQSEYARTECYDGKTFF